MATDQLETLVTGRIAELTKANEQLQAELAECKRTEEAHRLSEQRLRLAVRASNTGLWDWDVQTGEIYFSPEWKAQIGYEDDELKNRLGEWEDRLHPEDRERVLSTVNAYLANPWSNYEVEFRLRHKDRSYRWILARATLFTDDEGKPRRMLGSHLDITERKRAEEALGQSEKKFSTIFQTIPDPVAIVRLRDGLILDVNDAWTEQTGYTRSEGVGKTSEELNAYVDQEVRKSHIEQLLEKGKVQNLEAKYRIKGGGVGYGLLSAKVIELDGEQCTVAVTRSISVLKAAQESLRQSEEKFRTLAETTPSAIVVHRFDEARIQYVNPAMEEMSGYSRAELLELTLWDLLHPDSVEIVTQRRLARLRGEPVSSRLELKLVTKNGEARWVDQSIGVIEFEGDAALIVTAFDITDRKLAEEALQRSEAQYRALVENTPDIIARFDSDCRYLFVNSAVAQVSNLKLEDIIGKTLVDVGFSEEQARFRERVIRNVFDTRRPFETEFEFEGPNGMGIFEWRVYPEFDAAGNMQSVLSINRDITERKRAEEQVKQSRELLRALSAHLQSVREEERTMIAREIHDELGQALTGLKMDLSSVQNTLRKQGAGGLERCTERTTSMSKLIDATIQTVRRIATDLRPGILDDLGLVAAIEWQAQDFQKRTGIKCKLAPGVEDLELDSDRSTAAFRIFQETLTNVARHSLATEVDVSLSHCADGVVLEIKDNGKGIQEADISGSRSLGLLGMRERAHLLGGELKVSGTPGEGTTVIVRIPLS